MAFKLVRMLYAPTGSTYYSVVVNQINGKMYNTATEQFADGTSRIDAAVEVEEFGSSARYKIYFPAEIEGGNYDIVVYLQSGGDPNAATDTLVDVIKYSNGGTSSFGF